MPDRPVPTDLDRDPLDDELHAIAAALVAEAPDPPDLPAGAVAPARLEARGRRRAVLVAAAAVLVAVAAGVGVVGLDDDPDTYLTTLDAPKILATSPGAQRVILEAWPGEAVGEGWQDRMPVPLAVGGLDPAGLQGPPRGLADGRHVLVGTMDAPPTDPEATPPQHLVVMGTDGSAEADRRVDRAGEYVTLLAATPTEAILARPTGEMETFRVVAHDLATGSERLLALVEERGFLADAAGDRLVVVTAPRRGQSCVVRSISLVTGAPTDIAALPCRGLLAVRMSPSTDRVAVAYIDDSAEQLLRLAGFEVASGRQTHDSILGANLPCTEANCAERQPWFVYGGMGWEDETTLDVALVDRMGFPDWDEGEPVTEDQLVVVPVTN